MAIYKVIFHNIIRPVFLLLYHSLRQRTSRACTAGRKRPNNSRTAAERENAYEPIDRCKVGSIKEITGEKYADDK